MYVGGVFQQIVSNSIGLIFGNFTHKYLINDHSSIKIFRQNKVFYRKNVTKWIRSTFGHLLAFLREFVL